MWPFRRRARGRHALGAAVTAIPSARPSVPELIERAVTPPTPVAVAVAQPPVVEAQVVEAQVLHPEPPPGVRVELGFRDGSTAALAPGSEQAKALSDIASVLTQRD